jgi:MYXO-CTERM domain-containing protein
MIRSGFTILALGTLVLSGGALMRDASVAVASPALQGSSATHDVKLPSRVTMATARHALSRQVAALERVTLMPLDELPASISGTRTFRFQQMYRGVRILGERAILSVSSKGVGRATANAVSGLPTSVQPTVTAAQAHDVARRVARTSFRRPAELVIVPSAPGQQAAASLAWLFFEPAGGGVPYAPQTAIDANTGEVIFSINRVVFAGLAEVHEENPVSTPTPQTVTLPGLAPDATTLSGDTVSVFNCIDTGTVGELFGANAHKCDQVQTALADENGDFTAHKYESDTAAEDTYAEVAMYHHVTKVQAAMAALGAPDLGHMPATVNLRMPSIDAHDDPAVPLMPFANAFFAPEEEGNGSIWFGQGEFADFAYDGDVIYHEYGHAVVGATAELFGALWIDDFGATVEPGALNEGLADYLSATLTNDSMLGEYAGGSFGLTAIRNLENDATCPKSLSGEVHHDSEMFSSALWAQRLALPAKDRVLLDVAVMDSLKTVPSSWINFSGMASHIVSVVGDAPGLGDDAASALEQIFTDKGILPECERILELPEGETFEGREFRTTSGFIIPSIWYVPVRRARLAPATFQFHGELAPDNHVLKITGSAAGFPPREYWFPEPSGDPFEPILMVQFGADPIQFDYSNGVETDAEIWSLDEEDFAIEIDIPDGATEVHFMFGNRGEEDGLVGGVTYQTLEGEAPSENGGAGGTAGSGGSPDHSAEGGDGGEGAAAGGPALNQGPGVITTSGDGCGCSVPGRTNGSPPSLAWLFVGLLPLLRRRRG